MTDTRPADPDPDRRWIEYMPLEDIQLADRNPRLHDGQGIKRSISEHGLGELPMLDERTGKLVAGHGRLHQLVQLHDAGRKPRYVKVADTGQWLVPVQRGWSSTSDDQAQAYLIGSNQIGRKTGWDDRELAEILEGLEDAHYLEIAGFEQRDLDNLRALHSDGWDPPDLLPGSGNRARNTGPGGGGAVQDPDQEELGLEPTAQDREMWPMIQVRVPPHHFDAWRATLAQFEGKTDADKVAELLRHLGHLQ